jgi:hypothetical protein
LFRNLSEDLATFMVIRYRIASHTDLGDGAWSERLEPVSITKYRSPVWMHWCGILLPTPHDELLPLLDDGWRSLAEAAKRAFPDAERALRVEN